MAQSKQETPLYTRPLNSDTMPLQFQLHGVGPNSIIWHWCLDQVGYDEKVHLFCWQLHGWRLKTLQPVFSLHRDLLNRHFSNRLKAVMFLFSSPCQLTFIALCCNWEAQCIINLQCQKAWLDLHIQKQYNYITSLYRKKLFLAIKPFFNPCL